VALALIVPIVMLFVSAMMSMLQVSEAGILQTVLAILDRVLLVFILVELLYTISIIRREHGFIIAEPFLLVGLIAVVRRILLVTAQIEQAKGTGEFERLLATPATVSQADVVTGTPHFGPARLPEVRGLPSLASRVTAKVGAMAPTNMAAMTSTTVISIIKRLIVGTSSPHPPHRSDYTHCREAGKDGATFQTKVSPRSYAPGTPQRGRR
jgi:hypothetical protein